MPFARPSLSDLRVQAANDINASLPGVDALLRFSNLGIIGDVLAGLMNGQYGYADWIALQSVPFTATDEFLEGWAALKGVTRKPAVGAVGTATFAAVDGTVVPAGSPVTRSDGIAFTTTADAVAAGGSVTVQVQADRPGADTNTAAASRLVLGVGIAGLTPIGMSGVLVGGVDIEDDAALRGRMLIAYANPPQGGSVIDYSSWALAVPGVTRCWIEPGGRGAGTVVIYFMMDNAEAAHAGFPQGTDGCSAYETRDIAATGDQLVVADALFPLQSVTALVYAVAPTQNVLDFSIALPGATNTTKAAIASAIAGALLLNAVPGGLTYVSSIEAAIAAVTDTAGFVLTGILASAGTVDHGGTGNILSSDGALPVLGAITWA